MSACGILQMNNGWRVGVGHLSPKYQGNFSSLFTYLSFPSPILMKVYMCVSWKSVMVLWEQSGIPNGPRRLFVFLVSSKTHYIYLLAAFIFRFQVPIKIKQILWDISLCFPPNRFHNLFENAALLQKKNTLGSMVHLPFIQAFRPHIVK